MSISSFEGHVAAVTGAGSGIGQQLAVLLSNAGCHVAIADVNDAGLEETRALMSNLIKVSIHHVDVADRQAVEDFARDVVKEHGCVNMVFNNAGVSVTGSVEQMPIEDMEWLMAINFWGVVYGCKAFLPFLRDATEAAIVNTSSIFGTITVPGQSIYNASKFAVKGYTLALRQELLDTHIGVSCVQPGGVKTNIVKASRFIPKDNESDTKEEFTAMFEQAAQKTSEEAAEIILKGVLRNKARILVGRDAHALSWLERLAPSAYMKLTSRFLD
ncbi:MAG: NADP-dependent 3-hydroxy acid dehydrogenase YdfG [Candidatus Azotimanducaceae bacterium]|jgi:NADP-dependent 3-hydroxy acid dehydrogenase YdfG